jgi:hypothetical protein
LLHGRNPHGQCECTAWNWQKVWVGTIFLWICLWFFFSVHVCAHCDIHNKKPLFVTRDNHISTISFYPDWWIGLWFIRSTALLHDVWWVNEVACCVGWTLHCIINMFWYCYFYGYMVWWKWMKLTTPTPAWNFEWEQNVYECLCKYVCNIVARCGEWRMKWLNVFFMCTVRTQQSYMCNININISSDSRFLIFTYRTTLRTTVKCDIHISIYLTQKVFHNLIICK